MASIGLQIELAVEARLGVASVELPSGTKTPPAGLVIQRERISDVRPDDVRDGPLVLISIGAEPEINRVNWSAPATSRLLELLIGIYALANDTPGADAVDPTYNWIIHALQSEPRLGGLTLWISEEQSDSEYVRYGDSADIVSARELKVHFAFMTRTDDPEVRANP